MPFTLSHPAAALALRRTGLPMAAMVSGTVVPDVPLYLPVGLQYGFTHSLLGIVTVDLAAGMVGVLAWCWLLRDALVDSAPAVVRERFPSHVRYSRRQWFLVGPAVVVGSLTHVGWDELTHEGRWGPNHIAWLRETHLGAAGYHWGQAVSTVLGLLAVCAAIAARLVRSERRPRRAAVPLLANRAPWLVLGVATAAGLAAISTHAGDGLHEMAFASAVSSVAVLALTAVLAAMAWRMLARRAP